MSDQNKEDLEKALSLKKNHNDMLIPYLESDLKVAVLKADIQEALLRLNLSKNKNIRIEYDSLMIQKEIDDAKNTKEENTNP